MIWKIAEKAWFKSLWLWLMISVQFWLKLSIYASSIHCALWRIEGFQTTQSQTVNRRERLCESSAVKSISRRNSSKANRQCLVRRHLSEGKWAKKGHEPEAVDNASVAHRGLWPVRWGGGWEGPRGRQQLPERCSWASRWKAEGGDEERKRLIWRKGKKGPADPWT